MNENTSTPAPEEGAGKSNSLLIRAGIAVGVLAVLIGIGYFFGLDKYLSLESLENLRGWINDNKAVAVIAFVAIYAALVAISFPGATGLTIGGGFLFGQWIGTVAVVTAATTGAVIIFLLAKTVFGDALSRQAGGFVKKMEKGFKEGELSYMFLLRLVPAFPFAAVNIAAGLLNVNLRNYFIGTFFGIIPGSAVYVSIGNAIAAGTKTADDAGLLAVFSQPQVYVPFIGLALLGALPVVIKKFGGKQAAALTEETTDVQ